MKGLLGTAYLAGYLDVRLVTRLQASDLSPSRRTRRPYATHRFAPALPFPAPISPDAPGCPDLLSVARLLLRLHLRYDAPSDASSLLTDHLEPQRSCFRPLLTRHDHVGRAARPQRLTRVSDGVRVLSPRRWARSRRPPALRCSLRLTLMDSRSAKTGNTEHRGLPSPTRAMSLTQHAIGLHFGVNLVLASEEHRARVPRQSITPSHARRSSRTARRECPAHR